MNKLVVSNINKSYDKKNLVLKDVSFSIQEGTFVVIVGPSGCGKSTLLSVIAGVEPLDSGNIFIDGVLSNEIRPQKRDVAMVFQNYALYPTMNVYENIAFPLKNRKVKKNVIKESVLKIATLLRIENILDKKISAISGGQKQRVAIGRAIIRNPKIFLFDEPLSNLDASLRTEMRQELLNLHRELNATFLFVTHDQIEALTLADLLIVMDNGIIQQIGTPQEIYAFPQNEFVAKFIGSSAINLIEDVTLNKLSDSRFSCSLLGKEVTFDIEDKNNENAEYIVDIGIRPEDFEISTTNISELEARLTETTNTMQSADEFIKSIKKYLNAPELTREMCFELIDRIIVGRSPKTVGEDRMIDIIYKVDIASVLRHKYK